MDAVMGQLDYPLQKTQNYFINSIISSSQYDCAKAKFSSLDAGFPEDNSERNSFVLEKDSGFAFSQRGKDGEKFISSIY